MKGFFLALYIQLSICLINIPFRSLYDNKISCIQKGSFETLKNLKTL